MDIRIEPATERDIPLILRFTRGLAEYERLTGIMVATEASVRQMLTSDEPRVHVDIAYYGNEPAGIAVWFHNYSTFLAKRGLYLEDLFVLPEMRGHGVGRRLLAHLAETAVARGCGRMEWSVLNWNEPAIRFYRALGAELLDDWSLFRLTGAALQRLASEDHIANAEA